MVLFGILAGIGAFLLMILLILIFLLIVRSSDSLPVRHNTKEDVRRIKEQIEKED